ncbi:MAG: hypothetical protein AAF664_10045, partial [Planctomycetota bacterium]
MNAVFLKELRDVFRWTPLTILLGLVLAYMSLPNGIYEATQMGDKLLSMLGLAACLIAIGLGCLQSLFDIRNDSRGYLLHRNFTPSQIYWAKLGAGAVAYAISLAVPVLWMAVYLQWKGIEQLPTSAFQVPPFLLFAPLAFLLHPTVLWISNRDARLIGTRALPAAGVFGTLILIRSLVIEIGSPNDWFTRILLVFVSVSLVLIVLNGAKHAFAHQSFLPAATSSRRKSFANTIGISVSAIVLVCTLGFT